MGYLERNRSRDFLIHLAEQYSGKVFYLTLLHFRLFAFRCQQPAANDITTQTEAHVFVKILIRLLKRNITHRHQEILMVLLHDIVHVVIDIGAESSSRLTIMEMV